MKTVRHIFVILILCCQLSMLLPVTILAATGNKHTAGMNPTWMVFKESLNKEYSTTDILSAVGLQDMFEAGELQTVTVSETPFGNTIRLTQYYHGIPVLGSSVVIRVTNNNQLRCIYTTIVEWTHKALLSEGITADEARNIAFRQIKPTDFRGDVKVHEVILPYNGSPLLCWQVLIPASDPLGDWKIIVNAADGAIMLIENQLRFLNGNGLVFDPDPITATGDTTLRDDQDAADAIPEEAYSEIELIDISRDDDDLYILTGPYVDTDPTDDRARLEESDFSFDREDDHFEEVMVYFHIDR
ncbi:MAG: hypothetical protein HQ568_01570, partial [Calditrichaeota bacterium]|nr:hypothetical protein [Calditrichota bacterium]